MGIVVVVAGCDMDAPRADAGMELEIVVSSIILRLNQFADTLAQYCADQDIGIQNDGCAAHLALALVVVALFLRAYS